MKINRKNLLPFFLLTAFLLPGAVLAQGGKDEIRVPSEALRPYYTPEDFSGKLKKFRNWLESIQLPASGAEFQRRAKDFDNITIGDVQTQLMSLRSLATDPDLEEVTRLPRSWYGQIYNAALPLLNSAETLNGIKILCEERNYRTAKKIWEEAVEETLAVLDKPPKKLSKEALEPIIAKNRERRRKEYIKWYRMKQAEDLKKAKEKAASGGKKKGDKPKKKSKEEE